MSTRLFCFTEDNGAREDLSVLHEDILIVTAGPDMGQRLTDLVESIIRLDPRTQNHQFDRYDPMDHVHVVAALNKEGYSCRFAAIRTYVNE